MEIKIIICSRNDKGIDLTVNLNDTIGSAKEKYYSIVGSRQNNQWIYDACVLKDDETFSSIEIVNLDIIEAHPSSRGGGGSSFGIDMADISNKKGLIEGNFDKSAPDWRTLVKGLNVLGICKNNNCKAFNNKIACNIGLGKFDLVGDADQIKCPMCKNEVDPSTCCFSRCSYKFEGKKKSNGKTDIVKSEWKRVEKDYEYFDPGKSGIVTWLKLIIETKPL